MINKKSTIQVTDKTKQKLRNLKLTPSETYENIILRLIEKNGVDHMNTYKIEDIDLVETKTEKNEHNKKYTVYTFTSDKFDKWIADDENNKYGDVLGLISDYKNICIRPFSEGDNFATYIYFDVFEYPETAPTPEKYTEDYCKEELLTALNGI
jgi:hypothetical protein